MNQEEKLNEVMRQVSERYRQNCMQVGDWEKLLVMQAWAELEKRRKDHYEFCDIS